MKVYLWRAIQIIGAIYLVGALGLDNMLISLR